jgi:D-3-phosphoglycerate dehydrogenase / 2-oxoglutarate reductase
MARVVVTDHVFTDLELERALLAPLDAEIVVAPSTDAETLAELAREADALIVCYASIPRAVVDAAAEGGVRVIARYGIGYDNVDVEAATERGIIVTNVPDYCLDEVADHTLALLLASARGVMRGAILVRDGDWRVPHEGIHSLRDRQLTLLGLGRIGVKVAERALPFGLRVVAYDPFVSETPLVGVTLAPSLEAAVAEADFVSLHLPMSAENRHLIGNGAIAAMKRSPVLINTSRGGLVDLDAAVAALQEGRLSGVALDVTDPEPLPADHPLRTHPSAIVTPHMAFHSIEAQAELQRRAAEEVARALRGEPARSPVNPAARPPVAR